MMEMKWQYKIVQCHWNSSAETEMNNLGMQGWELVTCGLIDGYYRCVFKRLIP